ncbi:SMP-30/gluconolaconase/LRE-like protein [Herbihabitans rhizosphaerae]|uniref:SMP-30/gluconolaconase/LRE-like protein n=1 Tax=Herbihabitans rhizosphaerae TaxID=1872711 RepID=A0A4Q7KMV9_9PSEU|nr:SMP-30/gluconolactonase/LRE family protein [Herbihabitans rhizosphaerae]RZS37637.1 SMP-30/gluconolaconase/LRE-like protein [Herbihabitans rhizosphaerae]
MLRHTVVGAIALAATFDAPSASASTPATPRAHHWPGTITVNAESLHPEGVAWDPARHTLLVGSMRHGTVSVVDKARGTARPLIEDPRLISTFGLRVDAPRGRVLVTYSDHFGVGTGSTPDTKGNHSGLGIFDLATGRPLHLVDLRIGPGAHSANDVAVDHAGNAYVTDPASDRIFRVTPDGRAGLFAADPRFAGFGMNGIVFHPNGFLLSVHYTTGALYKIPLDGGPITEVALDRKLVGGDGLALRPDGSLIVVTNKLSAPGADALTVLRGGRRWERATEVRREEWPIAGPTTVAVTPHGSYAVSGHVGELLAGDYRDQFRLRALR